MQMKFTLRHQTSGQLTVIMKTRQPSKCGTSKDEGHTLNPAHVRNVSDVGPGTAVHSEGRCIDRTLARGPLFEGTEALGYSADRVKIS
jgi:hypothetical protein